MKCLTAVRRGAGGGGATTIHVMVINDIVHAYPDAVTIMYH